MYEERWHSNQQLINNNKCLFKKKIEPDYLKITTNMEG